MPNQKAILEVGAMLASGTKQAFKSVADGFREVAKGMSTNAAAMKEMGQTKAAQSLEKVANSINAVSDKIVDQTKDLGALTAAQDKNTDSTKKSTAALDKKTTALVEEGKSIRAKEKATSDAAKKEELSAKLLAKKEELARHLQITYYKLAEADTRWSEAARRTLKELKSGNMEMGVARDNVTFLNKKYNEFIITQNKSAAAYSKMDKELAVLVARYPKEAARMKEKALGYNKQIALLKEWDKIQIASAKAAVKAAIAEEKAVLSLKKRHEAINHLLRSYPKLIQSESHYAKESQRVTTSLRKGNLTIKEASLRISQIDKRYREFLVTQKASALAYEKISKTLRHLASLHPKEAATLTASNKSYTRQIAILKRLHRMREVAAKQQIVTERQRKAAKDLSLRYKELVGGADRYARAARKIEKALRSQIITVDQAARSFKNLALMQKQTFNAMTPLQQATQRLSKSFKSYMSYMAASSVIFGVINAFRTATTTVIEFDQALRDLQAITGATTDQVAKMDVKIRQVASDTKFSATEIADGMKLLGQSGFTVEESIETIDAVANLATGTLTSMATTVDLVTTAMRVFGIESGDSARVADVFANAVNGSKLTIDKMRIAMNYIGPVANAAGASFEEVASAMMVLANQGIRASTIGTGLRQVFRRLVDPNKALTAGLKEVGLTLDDVSLKSHSLENVLEKLKLVVKGNQEAFKMFGVRGSTAIIAFTKTENLNSLSAMLETVKKTGTAADMAAIQMQGLDVSFKNLQDKVKNLYLGIGDSGLTGALRMFVDTARGLTDFLTGILSNSLVQATSKFMLAAGAAQTFVVVLRMLASTGLAKAIFAPLIAGAGAYTTATGTATAATFTFRGAVIALKAALATLIPAAVVMGIVGLVQHITLMDDKVKESIRNSKAEKNAIDGKIAAVKILIRSIKKFNGTAEDETSLLKKLINTYPELSSKLVATGGDLTEITEVLKDYNKELDETAKKERTKQIGLQLRDIQLEISKFKRSNPFTDLFDEDSVDEDWIAFKGGITKKIANLVDLFNKAKKDNPKLSIDDFLGKLVGGKRHSVDVEKGVKKRLAELAAVAKIDAEKAGKEIGGAIATGVNKIIDDPDNLKLSFKLDTEDIQSEMSTELRNIAIMKAQGLMEEEAAEKKSVSIKLRSSKEKLAIAQDYAKRMALAPGAKDSDITAAETAAANALQKVLDEELRMIENFGSKRSKLIDKIADYQKKKADEVVKHDRTLAEKKENLETKGAEHTKAIADKRVEISKTHADKVVEIERTLAEKIIGLQDKIKESKRKTSADISSIENSTRDKILKIRQKDMSDSEKESSNIIAARRRLSEGLSALDQAKRSEDKEALDRAKSLIEKSGEYYESLENSGKAIGGLKKVGEALVKARQAQGDIEEAAINKRITKEKAEADRKIKLSANTTKAQLADFITKQSEKLAKATDVINKQIEKEDFRHSKAMANIQAEIVERQKEAAILKAKQEQVISSSVQEGGIPSDSYDGSSWLPEGWAESEGKKVGKAVEGAVEGAKGAISDAVKSSVKEGVTKGAQEGIFDSVLVEGAALEEWKEKGREAGAAQGKAQGEALADNMSDSFNYRIKKGTDGEPLYVIISDVAPEDLAALTKEIQTTLDEHPGEPALDFDPASKAIKEFIRIANNKYKITIPVSATQAQADGGPVVRMATGGRLPGQSSPKDKVDVKGRPGEWFIKNEAVSHWASSIGDWFMNGVNSPSSYAGKKLQGLLDLNGSIGKQNKSISSLASKASTGISDSMGEFGTVNFNLPGNGGTVPAMMKPNDVSEMMRQLENAKRFES